MPNTMTRAEREAFLADVHVGVMSIANEGHAPLTVPIWYAYEPGGELWIITGRASRKAQLLQRAGRFSLCAQTETPPYKYVTVEGPVIAVEAVDQEQHLRPMARRYLGQEDGDKYVAGVVGQAAVVNDMLVRMLPEHWLTVDYSKTT
jgi:nitroimidazol reductase NimA-like FMN-containing flavoprotein (pyridoxamine 5'-phosphate oxidase superfamily)